MTPNGVGVCYDLDIEFLGFLITTFTSTGQFTSEEFAKALFLSLNEMRMVLEATTTTKAEVNNIGENTSFSKL